MLVRERYSDTAVGSFPKLKLSIHFTEKLSFIFFYNTVYNGKHSNENEVKLKFTGTTLSDTQ